LQLHDALILRHARCAQHRRRQQLLAPADALDLDEIAGAEVFETGIE
jgi:hypothetical protein